MSERIPAHLAAQVALEVVARQDARRESLREALSEAEESLALVSWSDPMNAWNRSEVVRIRQELAAVETDLAAARKQAFEVALVAAKREGINFSQHLKEFSII